MTTNIRRLLEPIAAIDIETLGFAHNAVISEIGVIKTSVVPQPGSPPWDVNDLEWLKALGLLDYRVYQPSVLDQVKFGAVIETSTIEFHKKNRGEDFEHTLYANATQDIRTQVLEPLIAFLDTPVYSRSAPTEVWVNHPSFDVPRLEWLKRLVDFKMPLWHYRKECDVFTAVRMYRKAVAARKGLDLTKVQPVSARVHYALDDCVYNLSMVSIVNDHALNY